MNQKAKPGLKYYKAKKDGSIQGLILFLLVLPAGFLWLDPGTFWSKPFLFLPLLSPLALLLWIYFDTYYQLGPEDLFYKSGFLKGRIKIMDIREIVPGKTRHVGLKPALARQGLIVKYNRFDEIYLAPEHNEELIADLRQINDSIVIKK